MNSRSPPLGVFPHAGRPTVLWLGVRDASGGLAALQERVATAVAAEQIVLDRRPFQAHITLGRWRQPPKTGVAALLAEPLSDGMSGSAGRWTVREVTLMESRLSATGAVHTLISAFPLAESAGLEH